MRWSLWCGGVCDVLIASCFAPAGTTTTTTTSPSLAHRGSSKKQSMTIPRVVLDTNVLASAFMSGRAASREVLRRMLRGEALGLISIPLFTEYEDVLARTRLQQRCSLNSQEQVALRH